MPKLLDTRVIGQDLADVRTRNYVGAQPGWALRVNSTGKALELGPAYSGTIYKGPFVSQSGISFTNRYVAVVMETGETIYLGEIALTGGSTPILGGQIAFTTPGTHTWTVPDGVTSICAVAVGGGGGGGKTSGNGASGGNGGDLRWINDYTVTPGTVVTIVVGDGGTPGVSGSHGTGSGNAGGLSKLTYDDVDFLIAAGGNGGLSTYRSPAANSGSSIITGNIGGGDGGIGGPDLSGTKTDSGGGAGAAGYMGPGGNGGIGDSSPPVPGVAGFDGVSGGGGGGAGSDSDKGYSIGSAGGGGVGLKGQGGSGLGGQTKDDQVQCGGGQGGSGGTRGGPGAARGGVSAGNGGLFGGGGGGVGKRASNKSNSMTPGKGGHGAVRIIWGTGRSFPGTNTDDLIGTTPSYVMPVDTPCYYNNVVVPTSVDYVYMPQ